MRILNEKSQEKKRKINENKQNRFGKTRDGKGKEE